MLLTVIGTRPQYIKSSIVSFVLNEIGLEERKIDTGQHYDDLLSKHIIHSLPFQNKFERLSLPFNYESALIQLEKKTQKDLVKIKAVLVYGDTHSAMVGAMFAKKNGKKLIHIEAGERSWMVEMKEEFNRINIDYLADICFCVNKKSYQNLSHKNKSQKKIVGDVMLDLIQHESIKEQYSKNNSINPYILFTLHRDENTKDEKKVRAIMELLESLNQQVYWPVHPKCKPYLKNMTIPGQIKILKPLSYTKSLEYINNASMVITDSGGIQKEAYWLKTKCITIRPTTEWTETLKGNWNILLKEINTTKFKKAIAKKPDQSKWDISVFGNGTASKKIAAIIKSTISE